jgi:predicted amidohydrolase YtcJ
VRVGRGFGDEWLKLNGLKGFADGSLGSTTAWFDEPYADAKDTSGLPMPEMQNGEMADRVRVSTNLGLQCAVHAIGDRANRAMLDIYQELQDTIRPLRPRIEHAQHLHPDDIARFGGLSVIASMQPYHAIDDGRWADKRIGSERCRTTYAFRSLLDAGAVLAFGSDWPVAPLSPWEGLYAAVTRRTLDGAHPDGWVPEQRITIEEALRAYTRGSAFAAFDEQSVGSLAAGKLADLIVLDRDVLALDDPEDLRGTKVDLTMVGGRIVFRR